ASQGDSEVFCGGCGGTVGAILTCPLEVVKTRLQSSSVTLYISEVQLNTVNRASVGHVARVSPGPLHCLKLILEKEGPRWLFRGLGPNLVGVAPSRLIGFLASLNCKLIVIRECVSQLSYFVLSQAFSTVLCT
uniref:Uncharacterized protein n=1 Tax=Ornithorhynchus anatinus TaxID=9258 RepID=A0A6I8NDZ6_ORNAN